MKYGLLATTSALVGGSHNVGAADPSRETAGGEPSSTRGVMFPYQFTPNARFRILENGLDWRPERIDSTYDTHVIEYEYARSLRAYLFTETELAPGENRTFELGATQSASPIDSDRCLVGVTAESNAE